MAHMFSSTSFGEITYDSTNSRGRVVGQCVNGLNPLNTCRQANDGGNSDRIVIVTTTTTLVVVCHPQETRAKPFLVIIQGEIHTFSFRTPVLLFMM